MWMRREKKNIARSLQLHDEPVALSLNQLPRTCKLCINSSEQLDGGEGSESVCEKKKKFI